VAMAPDADQTRRGCAAGARRCPSRLLNLALAVLLLGLPLGCSTQRTREELPLPYRQAEDAFRLGDFDRAARGYRAFIEGGGQEAKDLVPRAYYKMALAEYRRERYGECLTILNEMGGRFPSYDWPQADTLHGDAELKRGNTATAMLWWERAWAAADDNERDALAQRITESISGLNKTTLVRARAALSTREIQELVDKRIAQLDRGEPASVATPKQGRQIEGPPATPGEVAGRIGCLLPLSGPYAVYGQRCQNAIRLALGPVAEQLVVRDTAGKVDTARAALNELMADPSVVGVIGPLRSEEAAAIAPQAEQAGVPMIALSQREGIAGKFVLQPTMTNERQAAALAEYAVKTHKLGQIGIIYPNDAYGNGLAEAFTEQVTRRQGRIVGSIAYEAHASEFGVEVLTMKKWADEGLDAVFLPGYADTAIELAKALRQAQPDLMLLGSNGWHDPQQLQRAARELDGLVFVDGFFAESQRQATRAFVDAYRAAYGTAPEILEAQAYDAASLLLRALQAGAHSRADVVPQLMALRSVQGTSGTIVMAADGLQRELFVLQLVDGVVREAAQAHAEETAAQSGEDAGPAKDPADERALTGGLR